MGAIPGITPGIPPAGMAGMAGMEGLGAATLTFNMVHT